MRVNNVSNQNIYVQHPYKSVRMSQKNQLRFLLILIEQVMTNPLK